ncbi:hypothetical protein [Kitasatospora sp. NPDC059327]|uniref:hypothetical protein n=1 Tax=Kitasatospora sp. NPDC059327 TaxID=3346803 RepID=UPI0036B9A912
MGEVSALAATGHPLQRAGAWAVTVLADRADPGRVSEADLEARRRTPRGSDAEVDGVQRT